ncbi:MAG TPA: arsenosugar biosynthesis radical SAM (seleno)protein ArsS [Candidatus Binataceae bacterium]|jgi:radical SAM/Cys-rich protein|nr:arsenosugar biosynthesis radical SAM (seleno)protein ArsS [Candidatus Binataceae bacterium]
MMAAPDFDATLREHALGTLRRSAPRTLQINVGKLCNQACHHCHVDAGPGRKEQMSAPVAERLMEVLAASPAITTVDLTGGAPELNANFRYLIESGRAMGRHVMVRCNLTVLFVPAMEWLADFYRDAQVELVCSLPCYTQENVEQQRGKGVFAQSIAALRLLNRLGYGCGTLRLNLVYNPLGAFLPPAQAELEARYRQELRELDVEFDRLFTITNMPIKRFARQLRSWGKEAEYMSLLVNHFNPEAVGGLMCRSLVSAGYEGTLYDCDFNQMLELPLMMDGNPLSIWDVHDLAELEGAPISTGAHCFGCTAGSGSSCGGALT